jgi:hypothetical protein
MITVFGHFMQSCTFSGSNDRKPLDKPSKTVKNWPFWILKILFLQKINSVNQWLNIDLQLFNA